MTRVAFLTALFGFSSFLYAQRIPDSLQPASKDELIRYFNRTRIFSEREGYGKTLIAKARSENDISYLVTGYHIMAVLYKDEKSLLYCDSIIGLTEASPDKFYPATAYLLKGSYYYNKRAFKKALDNYIIANTYAKRSDSKDMLFKITYAIGILKDRIGAYKESIALHRENLTYAKAHTNSGGMLTDTDYLNSIFALANTFNEMQQLDSATFYNSYGIRESLRLKNQQKYRHFGLNSGVTNYYQKNYQSALDSIRKSLPYFEGIDDKPNMAVGYYYLGRLYFEFDREEEAVFYLKKVDTVFRQNKDVLPKLRESYILLKEYYKEKNDPDMQLHYVEQLIKLDSILHSNELYLNKNIIKEYDIPRLIAEKETIISTLSKKETRARQVVIIVSAILLIAILLLYYQYNRIKLYKRQAEALTKGNHIRLKKTEKNNRSKSAVGISKEIVEGILSGLKTFEKKKGYLDTELNIHTLSKELHTNANYLSKVINYYKSVSFTHYVNRLRIEYAINALKTDPMYRKFTIQALARDFGFNTGESFSGAFYKYTGTKPSYFIRELHKL